MTEEEKEIELLNLAKKAVVLAGEEIMKVYAGDFDIQQKADDTPLTTADRNANKIIEDILRESNIPILSEEGIHNPYEERKKWDLLWIVDPLDGTKEFIKRNGEFTVNIALVKQGAPILGVIYVPDKKWMYYGYSAGSFREIEGKEVKLPIQPTTRVYRAVGSRSHPSPETAKYFAELKKEKGEVEIVSMGSSLKICLVAEGSADVYPRFAPTMEWDTAAGHAIAKYAGKKLIDYKTKKEMVYNRSQLRNNWFIVN